MSLSLLRFVNEFRASNPLAKVDVEGSNPFSRSKILRSEVFSLPSRQAAYSVSRQLPSSSAIACTLSLDVACR